MLPEDRSPSLDNHATAILFDAVSSCSMTSVPAQDCPIPSALPLPERPARSRAVGAPPAAPVHRSGGRRVAQIIRRGRRLTRGVLLPKGGRRVSNDEGAVPQ